MGSTLEIAPHLLDAIDEIDARLQLDTRTFGINADLQRLLRLNTVNSDNAVNVTQGAPALASPQPAKQKKAKRTKSRQKNCTASSIASNTVAAVRSIGAGDCGVVFAGQDGRFVMKLSRKADTSLWNDYRMQAVIAEAMTRYCPNVHVPKCHYFVPQDQLRFFEEHPDVVQAARDVVPTPTNVLVTERIRPLPEVIRCRLVEKYCPSHFRESALGEDSNKDCLVRVYFGAKRSGGGEAGDAFSLRDFKLHLDDMIELDLNTEHMVERMAVALAVMHWGAGTDARGVEFVLGSKTTPLMRTAAEIVDMSVNTATGAESGRFEDMFWDTTQFWVLDFDQVQSMTMDVHGVAQAVEAASCSGGFMPRPRQSTPEEKRLWNAFVHVYLHFSEGIITMSGLGDKVRALPPVFIEGLIRREEQRMY